MFEQKKLIFLQNNLDSYIKAFNYYDFFFPTILYQT